MNLYDLPQNLLSEIYQYDNTCMKLFASEEFKSHIERLYIVKFIRSLVINIPDFKVKLFHLIKIPHEKNKVFFKIIHNDPKLVPLDDYYNEELMPYQDLLDYPDGCISDEYEERLFYTGEPRHKLSPTGLYLSCFLANCNYTRSFLIQ